MIKHNNMIKITENNRSLVFLVGTLILGILIIGTLVFLENNDVESVQVVNEQTNTNYKDLENKIDELKNQNFNPTSYNSLASEIDESFRQDLITSSAKTNLITKLTSIYSDLVYNQCEFFLSGNNSNGQDVLNWLTQLESITSKNSKIDRYRGQIKWYNYYAKTLTNKVDNFINPGITNYDDNTYRTLMNEVQTMPNFEKGYANKSKFIAIKSNLTRKLQNFNTEFYSN